MKNWQFFTLLAAVFSMPYTDKFVAVLLSIACLIVTFVVMWQKWEDRKDDPLDIS
jgi:hypothetical protein